MLVFSSMTISLYQCLNPDLKDLKMEILKIFFHLTEKVFYIADISEELDN